MKKIKTPLAVFIVAFFLNLLWENAQAPFYQGYESFSQHFWICLPASLWDAGYVTILYLLLTWIQQHWFLPFKTNDNKCNDRYIYCHGVFVIAIVAISLTTAAIIELRALAQGRWAYTAAMPLVPLTTIGLLPFLQLAILSLATYWIVPKIIKR